MITQQLAQFAVATDRKSIPDAAVENAGLALLDLVGVALGGYNEPVSTIVRQLLPDPRPHSAAAWGPVPLHASAEDAAFVNAVQSHALDFDDSSSNMRAHPSCTMLPTAMAAGELFGCSGDEVLASYAIGLNVASAITPALGPGHYLEGWHTTSTIGIFGSTAAAGRLAGLDVAQMQVAFGIAASLVSGLSRNFGTMTKPFHAGHAARSAIQAVRMAKAGFTADMNIFDGPQNVLQVHGGISDGIAPAAVDSLRDNWEIVHPGILVKRWPCCYATHRALAGLRLLQDEHKFSAGQVSGIRVGFPPGTEGPLKYRFPVTGLQGKFSVEYVLAAQLLDGAVTIGSFTDELVTRPASQDLMQRISRYDVPGERILSSLSGFTDLEVVVGAEVLRTRVEKTPGSHESPLSHSERMEKFMDCAGCVLPGDSAERLAARLQSVRQLRHVRDLFYP